jgi:hypothetical protein
VGSSSERLDSKLDEGPNELNSRKLLLRSSSELLDLLHQRFRNLQLFVGKVMPPGDARSKNAGGPKFFKTELFGIGGFILGIIPLRSPPGIVFGCLKVEVLDVWAHLDAEATGLIWQRVSNGENLMPRCPVGFDP